MLERVLRVENCLKEIGSTFKMLYEFAGRSIMFPDKVNPGQLQTHTVNPTHGCQKDITTRSTQSKVKSCRGFKAEQGRNGGYWGKASNTNNIWILNRLYK